MEDFVPFKIAQKLKEKGYPMIEIPTGGRDNRILPVLYDLPKEHPNWQDCKAWWVPTISQVLKWLRDKKKLYVGVTYSPKIEGSQDFFYATIQYIGDYKKTIYTNDSYVYWEGAALNGIEYVLDNLI